MERRLLKPLTLALIAGIPGGILVAPPANAVVKGSTSEINVDEHGIALSGYDPVAYFDSGKPTPGVESLSASYDGTRYLFATAAHQKTFVDNPRKYVPEFGGFCAVGASFGEKVGTDPQTGKVVNGKLYLNYNARALALFNKDETGTIRKAEANWPAIKNKPQ